MKTLKRSIALALSIITLLSMCITAHAAYTPQHTEEAEVLYDLGLFKGTGTNADGTPIFALEQKANRIQGLVMLIRLLGKEADALAYTGECPFNDVPAWAEKYAAYAYDNGITKGTSATTFGSDDPLVGKAYVTFVLRALGYDDGAGEFSYNSALTFGAEVGLIGAVEYTGDLYRDDCAQISYTALKTNMKGVETTLLDKLVADGVLTEAVVQASGVLYGKVSIPVSISKESNGKYTFVFQGKDILNAVPDAAYTSNGSWGGTTADMFQKMNITPVGVVSGSRDFQKYLNGQKPSRSALTPTSTWNFQFGGGNNLTILAVFDSEFNLLAFSVVAPGFADVSVTEWTFNTCHYNGKEDLKRVETLIQSAKRMNADVVYSEKIITVQSDGTETVEQYLRIDESKWPANLGKPFYFAIQGGDVKEAMMRLYSSCGKDLYSIFEKFAGSKFDSGIYLILCNEARDVIAYVTLPSEIEVVETKIEP